jgi:hypothetical protein
MENCFYVKCGVFLVWLRKYKVFSKGLAPEIVGWLVGWLVGWPVGWLV